MVMLQCVMPASLCAVGFVVHSPMANQLHPPFYNAWKKPSLT